MKAASALEAENAILRGMVARLMPCHYCGAETMAKCPSGFPGCGLADDLLLADDYLGDGVGRLKARVGILEEALRAITEEREPCADCGKPHECRQRDGADPKRGVTWADPEDGHTYRRLTATAIARAALASPTTEEAA